MSPIASDPPSSSQQRRLRLAVVAVLVLTPLLAGVAAPVSKSSAPAQRAVPPPSVDPGGPAPPVAPPGDPPASPPPTVTPTPTATPTAATPTPPEEGSDGTPPAGNDSLVLVGAESSYAACADRGPIRGAVCSVIEHAKRRVVDGALDATQGLARAVLEVILRRPAPRTDGTIAVFRPPTNQPLAGAYTAWTAIGLPLGFLLWTLGAGVALASRFRPQAGFATTGFQIEQRLGRTLLLVLGSWWVGAFVLHLANGLILAVAPRGAQLIRGAETGVGTLLGTGLLAGLLWLATAAVVTLLFVVLLLAYFVCLTFLAFLPVFSALLLFDSGGVLAPIGGFGETGWELFIRAAFFPLPAALVFGAGSYVATGTLGFIQGVVAVPGLDVAAGTLAVATITFVTQLTALVATLWMLLGSGAAQTAAGVVAGLGSAAVYSRARAGVGRLAQRAHLPRPDLDRLRRAGAAASEAAGSAAEAGAAAANAPGTGTASGRATGALPGGTPGTGTTAAGTASGTAVQATAATDGVVAGGTAAGGATDSGDARAGGPVAVTAPDDLPAGQSYQPGYVADGTFYPAESTGLNRQFVVREHDRFAAAYDSDGDHDGVLLRGTEDDRLYDASAVAGADWSTSTGTGTGTGLARSRDAVFDARERGGGR